MTDNPPQLQQLPQQSGFNIPTLSSNMEGSNGSQRIENARSNLYNSEVSKSNAENTSQRISDADVFSATPARVTLTAQYLADPTDASAAAETVQNHPVTQSAKDTLSNGEAGLTMRPENLTDTDEGLLRRQ